MMFRQLQGDEEVVKALAGMVDSGRIPHAIMLHEDDGGGAVSLALAFLQYLYCRERCGGDSCGVCPSCNKIAKMIHPDVHFIFPTVSPQTSVSCLAQWRELVLSTPGFTETELNEALGMEGKSSLISVAEAKYMLSELSLSALEGGYRSVIIYLPEKMNQEAANRLLKMIEEPPRQTQFMLVTHAPEKVLTTISSRCQRIRLKPRGAAKDVSGESLELCADLYGQLMDALFSRKLLDALEVGEALAALPSRETAKAFCRYAAGQLRLIFLCQQGLTSLCGEDARVAKWAAACRKNFPRLAAEAVDRSRSLIERNVNLKILFTDLVSTLYTTLYER